MLRDFGYGTRDLCSLSVNCSILDLPAAVVQVVPAVSSANVARARSSVRTMAMAGDGTLASLRDFLCQALRPSRHIVSDRRVP